MCGGNINNMPNEEHKDNQSTDGNEKPQLSSIGAVELEACRLWFEGYSSSEIEKTLVLKYGEAGVRADTVRRWFSRGGKLNEFYKGYAENEAKARRRETSDAFRAHLKNALRTLVQIMNDPTQHTPSRVRAAEAIINRELGEPVKPVLVPERSLAREILEEAGIIDKVDDAREAE